MVGTQNSKNMALVTARLWFCGPSAARPTRNYRHVLLLYISVESVNGYCVKILPSVPGPNFTESFLSGKLYDVTSSNWWLKLRQSDFSNKSPTRCNSFPVYYPDVHLQLNMFRAFSRSSSGAQWLQWQPLGLPSYRGDSRALFVVGPTTNTARLLRR